MGLAVKFGRELVVIREAHAVSLSVYINKYLYVYIYIYIYINYRLVAQFKFCIVGPDQKMALELVSWVNCG